MEAKTGEETGIYITLLMKISTLVLLGRRRWRELLRRRGLGPAAVPAEHVAPQRQDEQQEDRRDRYHKVEHG